MDENNVNEEFDALTEGVKLEKMFHDLAGRAEFARMTAMHAASVFKAARKNGLPRPLAMTVAKEYWDSEMHGPTVVIIGEGDQ